MAEPILSIRSMRNLSNLVFLTVIFGTLTLLPSLAKNVKPSHKMPGYTDAHLTLNDFGKGGDGGDASECDERYHRKTEMVVALSTGWFRKKAACRHYVMIYCPETKRTATALVVDECDSNHGNDKEHAYQPKCATDIVDGSEAVWKALGINKQKGKVPVQWRYGTSTGKGTVKKKKKKKKKKMKRTKKLKNLHKRRQDDN